MLLQFDLLNYKVMQKTSIQIVYLKVYADHMGVQVMATINLQCNNMYVHQIHSSIYFKQKIE